MSRPTPKTERDLELARLREEVARLHSREWYIRLADVNQRLREEIAELRVPALPPESK